MSSALGSYDVVIIGGGPSGSALATHLAKAGRNVALFERDNFPRDKLCGEFLSGESRQHLEDLGCWAEIESLDPAELDRCRFTAPTGTATEVALGGGGLGLSRRVLDSVLFRHASESGATAISGMEVKKIGTDESPVQLEVARIGEGGSDERLGVAATLVVGAYGRREALDRELGRSFLRARHPYVGFKRHHLPSADERGLALAEELRGMIEIHAFEGGYCGITLIEGGVINVCMLVTQAFVRALPSARWNCLRAALIKASPGLAARLEALEPCDTTTQAVASVPFSHKEKARPPIYFVGDAAGMIAPLCGDGQAMAFRSAKLLAGLILDLPGSPSPAELSSLGKKWERAWRREFALRVRLGRLIQPMLLRGRPAAVAVRIAERLPFLGRWLVDSTRGE